jgi:hypothetical protein
MVFQIQVLFFDNLQLGNTAKVLAAQIGQHIALSAFFDAYKKVWVVGYSGFKLLIIFAEKIVIDSAYESLRVVQKLALNKKNLTNGQNMDKREAVFFYRLKVYKPSDALVRTSMSEKAIFGVDFLILIDSLYPFVCIVLHNFLTSVHFVHFYFKVVCIYKNKAKSRIIPTPLCVFIEFKMKTMICCLCSCC